MTTRLCAMQRCIRMQTLAESTQRLSLAFKSQHPDIPWRQLAGFRNQLAHGYLGVDLDIVFDIIQHDLPGLAQCVRTELAAQLQHREGKGFTFGR